MKSIRIAMVIMITCILFSCGGKKTGFVKPMELFEGFRGKQELQVKLDGQFNQRKLVLDSAVLSLDLVEGKLRQSPDDVALQRKYMERRDFVVGLQQEYETEHGAQDAEYSRQVWDQINQYVSDYGKENGYAYIYGANGSGSLMYGSDTENITKEMLEYINGKYEGN